MNNIDKLLKYLQSQKLFAELYESGYTSKKVKEHIIDTLMPFFKKKKNLKKYAIEFMVPDFVSLNRMREKYPKVDNDLLIILNTYSNAISKNKELLFDTIGQLMPNII